MISDDDGLMRINAHAWRWYVLDVLRGSLGLWFLC